MNIRLGYSNILLQQRTWLMSFSWKIRQIYWIGKSKIMTKFSKLVFALSASIFQWKCMKMSNQMCKVCVWWIYTYIVIRMAEKLNFYCKNITLFCCYKWYLKPKKWRVEIWKNWFFQNNETKTFSIEIQKLKTYSIFLPIFEHHSPKWRTTT